MALYTKTEFWAKAGVQKSTGSMHIKRSKIVVNPDGMIDDAHPTNAAYLKLQRAQAATADAPDVRILDNPAVKTKQAPAPQPKHTSQSEADAPLPASGDVSSRDIPRLTAQEKQRKVKKLDSEIILNNLKVEKIQGALLPTDLVMPVVFNALETMWVAYNDALDKVILKFSGIKELNNIEKAEFRKEVADILNAEKDKGINTAKKNLNAIVREFRETKDVGERE